MEVTETHEVFELDHEADVGMVRRRFAVLASSAGLDEGRASDAALIATETATNVLKHAHGGGALLAVARRGARRGVSIAVWDRGPGMNVEASLRDGVSTTGTAGGGLGAIARLASQWDAYSAPGRGTVICASVFPRGPMPRGRFDVAGICVPYPGLPRSGDAWEAYEAGDLASLIVCDGLGHGDGAADAAAAVIASFREDPMRTPAEILEHADRAARSTRGAAATAVRIDLARRVATVAGVGNVVPWIIEDRQRQLVTHHGTLGQAARIRQEDTAFPPGALLIVQSDGLRSRWALSDDVGLAARAPVTIATVLWRDLARGHDDATVVVARAGR